MAGITESESEIIYLESFLPWNSPYLVRDTGENAVTIQEWPKQRAVKTITYFYTAMMFSALVICLL